MTYTMKQLEQSIKNIIGEDVFNALVQCKIPLPTIHNLAIRKAFMTDINGKDESTLRHAARDLDEGSYKPDVDGEA